MLRAGGGSLGPETTPTGNEVLHDYADPVGGNPVEDKPNGEDEAQEPEEDREHEGHHFLLGRLGRIHGRGLRHLLLDVHGEPRQADQKEREEVSRLHGLDGEVHAEEAAIHRDDGVEDGQPSVEFAGKADEALRGERHDKVDGPKQADEDGHLDDHGAEAADGVEAHLLVRLHDLLLALLGVVLVTLVDDLHLGPE